jgi:hypothetical protein
MRCDVIVFRSVVPPVLLLLPVMERKRPASGSPGSGGAAAAAGAAAGGSAFVSASANIPAGVVRTYEQERAFIEQVSSNMFRIKKGFVPNMRVRNSPPHVQYGTAC